MDPISQNPVYDIALSYQKTAALIAAVRLDLCTHIGRGLVTVPELAAATQASERGIRILCDFMALIGFLTKDGSTYALTPGAARFLDRASPSAVGDSVEFLAAPEMISLLFDDPAGYVRRGGSPGLANVSPDNPVWVRYARAMIPFAATTAKRVAPYIAEPGPRTVLDIAAGHGLYSIEIARRLPEAQITAVDWAPVLEVAIENASAAGVTDRYHTIAGSAFDVALDGSYDAVLMANILHHFSHEECVDLLGKASKLLSPDGRLYVVEFVPDEDRISPPEPAAFAFWMVATTPHGDAFTLADYDAMARDAGFSGVTGRRLRPTPETLVEFKR